MSFWKCKGEKRGKPPLPVEIPENLYLFKRLAGITLAPLCDREDWALLRELVFHDYWLMQAAAAERMPNLQGLRSWMTLSRKHDARLKTRRIPA